MRLKGILIFSVVLAVGMNLVFAASQSGKDTKKVLNSQNSMNQHLNCKG